MDDATFSELQRRYDAAYQEYLQHAQAVDRALKIGEKPDPNELHAEATALHELSEARRELIAAISDRFPS